MGPIHMCRGTGEGESKQAVLENKIESIYLSVVCMYVCVVYVCVCLAPTFRTWKCAFIYFYPSICSYPQYMVCIYVWDVASFYSITYLCIYPWEVGGVKNKKKLKNFLAIRC
jgi:hypothetical protein